jgi:uncharacterized protein (DUF1697 family)
MKTAAETQYLALLRGINVGGNNLIKMTDLKYCFEKMKLTDVITYIQSGNVIFKSGEKDKTKLTDKLEKKLSDTFNYKSKIVLITHKQLRRIIQKAPEGFGAKPGEYKYDVLFLKAPLTPVEAIKSVRLREGVDSAFTGKDVLYFSRLMSRAGESYLNKIITLPVYQSMTIRNWNTTSKLLALMNK